MSPTPEGSRMIWSLSKRAFTDGAQQVLDELSPLGILLSGPNIYYAMGQKRFSEFPRELIHPVFAARPNDARQPIVEYGALYTPINEAIQEFIQATGNNVLIQPLDTIKKLTQLAEQRQVVVLPTKGPRNYSILAIQLLPE